MTLSSHFSKAEQRSRTNYDDSTMLLDDLQNLIDTAEDFLESTASYSGPDIEAARSKVVAKLNTAREHARHHRRFRVYQRASDIAHTSGRYVSEHKWQSATALAAVAALIGGIYTGRRLLIDRKPHKTP